MSYNLIDIIPTYRTISITRNSSSQLAALPHQATRLYTGSFRKIYPLHRLFSRTTDWVIWVIAAISWSQDTRYIAYAVPFRMWKNRRALCCGLLVVGAGSRTSTAHSFVRSFVHHRRHRDPSIAQAYCRYI